MIHSQLFGDCEPPANVPVIIFGGFLIAVVCFFDQLFLNESERTPFNSSYWEPL